MICVTKEELDNLEFRLRVLLRARTDLHRDTRKSLRALAGSIRHAVNEMRTDPVTIGPFGRDVLNCSDRTAARSVAGTR
jgi:hypothetical protein